MISHPQVAKGQQEAAARVQAMQEHARRMVREHPVNIYRGVAIGQPAPVPCPPPPVVEAPPCQPTPPPCSEVVAAPPCENNRGLSLLGGDNERLLLLLLAAVLAKNGAPLELLLALLYVAL